MVWGISKWGAGTKWGAASTLEWRNILATVASVNVSNSVQNTGNLFFSPVASEATIELYTEDNNPDVNQFLRLGTPIRITYINPNATPELWVAGFYGRIRNYSIRYDPQDKPVISISATSVIQDILSTVLPAYSAPAETSADRATRLVGKMLATFPELTGVNIASNTASFAAIPTGDYTFQELLEPLEANVFGWSSLNYLASVDQLAYNIQDYASIHLSSPQFTGTNLTPTTSSQVSYSQLTAIENTADLINVVVVRNTNGDVLASTSNNSTIQLFGNNPYEFVVDYATEADAFAWATTAVANRYARTYNAEFRGINLDGKLSPAQRLFSLQAAPAYAYINLDQNNVNRTDKVLVTRHEHTITPTNWLITIEATKEV
jgi:hypothetical protein